MERSELRIGDRVQLHPATDSWMRGDRYGRIIALGPKNATLFTDHDRRVVVRLANILEVVSR